MSRQVVRKVIDDREYDFYPMPPKLAVKVLTRLTKIIGRPLAELSGLVKGENDLDKILDNPMGMAIAARAASALVNNLEEDQVLVTIEQLLGPVHVKTPETQGTIPIQFDVHFEGRIGHLLKVVTAALEVNYSDFFAGNAVLAGIMARARRAGSIRE